MEPMTTSKLNNKPIHHAGHWHHGTPMLLVGCCLVLLLLLLLCNSVQDSHGQCWLVVATTIHVICLFCCFVVCACTPGFCCFVVWCLWMLALVFSSSCSHLPHSFCLRLQRSKLAQVGCQGIAHG